MQLDTVSMLRQAPLEELIRHINTNTTHEFEGWWLLNLCFQERYDEDFLSVKKPCADMPEAVRSRVMYSQDCFFRRDRAHGGMT